MLNAVGYGQPGSGLILDLVYNPGGAFLAPAQSKLQPVYKQELEQVSSVCVKGLGYPHLDLMYEPGSVLLALVQTQVAILVQTEQEPGQVGSIDG